MMNNFTGYQGQSPNNNNNLYNDLMKYNGMIPSYRTVFNDISDEWNACGEEERKFITKDKEYSDANLEYAQQFNAFLIDQFGLQFANSKYGSSAEKVLVSIRNARGRFKSAAAEDMQKIKNENVELQKQLKELEELFNANK